MIFKDRMRSLIVPQKLPSGKLSTRVLKPVTVCFEDGADIDNPVRNSSHASQSSEKKVRSISLFGIFVIERPTEDCIISPIKRCQR